MPGLLALALAYVLSQFYRSFLAVLSTQLSADTGADKADLALASGLWFVVFGLMQFVVGVGLDRFGPRRTCATLLGAGGAGGAFVFASAQSPGAIIVAMGMIGAGCAPVLMASLFIIARRFGMRHFAVLTSWLVAFGTLGNVIGASPLAWSAEIFGWRYVMAGLGILTFLVAGAIFLLVQDPKHEKPDTAGLGGYIELLKLRALWPILIMSLLVYAPVASIRGLWSGPYLSDLYNANSLAIGQVTLWMAIAMIIGSLAYGPLDKWLNTRKWIVFVGNLIVLFVLCAIVIQPISSITITTIQFIVIGICGCSYGVIMAHGRAFLPAHLIGRGVTLFNFCSIFGVGLLQFVAGRVVNSQADSAAPSTYQVLFATYAGLLFLTLLVYLFSTDVPPERETQ